jgi:CheY-like chemotaxis protein
MPEDDQNAANPCPTIRTLVVDDDEPFRHHVRAMLQARAEFQVIGEASDGLEAVQKAEELQPNLILLNIGLRKLSGIEAAHRISGLVPNATILFVSQNNDHFNPTFESNRFSFFQPAVCDRGHRRFPRRRPTLLLAS